MGDIGEDLLEDLYNWVDTIPLSRPKKDLKRDFADGVLVAEVVKHFGPRLVELHNYSPANCMGNKLRNWSLLNRKVFRKLEFEIADDVVKSIVESQQWAIEHFLMMLRRKIERYVFEQKRAKQRPQDATKINDRPEVDQDFKDSSKKPGKETKEQRLRKDAGGDADKMGEHNGPGVNHKGGMVPKVLVEEKEQELLVKEETIQILQAKVRRLEHLVHLKDVRIDDLQVKLDQLEKQLKPAAKTIRR